MILKSSSTCGVGYGRERFAEFFERPKIRVSQKYGNYNENRTTLELLESSYIAKYNLSCRNYCILLKISKELSRKIL
ncbi:hypothetical protein LEP1GSC098_2437 [Leptospira interrogans serovar Grippotyphosa str. UI 08434]|nr:hypothetical protein LEP1GSC098_2437 [Leptospira interrogans serovar Grippotyphosa str. UI 08434]